MALGRSSWSVWAHSFLRAASIVVLFVSLGFLIYCSEKFSAHLAAGYVVDVILLVFNICILIRLCVSIFGNKSPPGRAEAGWTSAADIITIILAIFGGIFMMLAYGQNRECGTDDCDSLRSYPAGPSRDKAAYLLYAFAAVTFFSTIIDFVQCCTKRKPNPSASAQLVAQAPSND